MLEIPFTYKVSECYVYVMCILFIQSQSHNFEMCHYQSDLQDNYLYSFTEAFQYRASTRESLVFVYFEFIVKARGGAIHTHHLPCQDCEVKPILFSQPAVLDLIVTVTQNSSPATHQILGRSTDFCRDSRFQRT